MALSGEGSRLKVDKKANEYIMSDDVGSMSAARDTVSRDHGASAQHRLVGEANERMPEMRFRTSTSTRRRQGSRSRARRATREGGQSLVEMTFGTVFLLGVVLVLFESAMIFRSYIGVLNVAREGAMYAAHHPDMCDCGQLTCADAAPDGDPYLEYLWHICQEADVAGLDPARLTILPPDKPLGTIDPQDPIIVTVEYELVNPTSGVVLPRLNRMGVGEFVPITASSEVPIRYGLD
jgi:hypothetical protein